MHSWSSFWQAFQSQLTRYHELEKIPDRDRIFNHSCGSNCDCIDRCWSSGGASESTARVQLASLKVAILNYKQDSHSTLFKFRNNNPSSVRINEMWVADKKCTLYPYNAILKPGESKSITCYGVVGLAENSRFEYDFNVTYTDLEINAQYIIKPDVKLIGTISEGSEIHTGMDACYEGNSATEQDCSLAAAEGQDGHVDGAAKSFTTLSDNVLKDEHTGLYWTTNESTSITRASAITYCEGLTQGGFYDWRLPNIVELTTVLDSGDVTSSSPEQSWTNGYYWSYTIQTTASGTCGSDCMWYVGVSPLHTVHRQTSDTAQNSVCVRGITTSINLIDSSKDFVDVSDGTVIDRDTGLIWEKELSTASTLSWNESTDHCLNLNKSGYTDWRLPTVSEGITLLDFGSSNSSNYLPSTFGAQPASGYWTGSTYLSDAAYAYIVTFSNGGVTDSGKTGGGAVRCVRDR